MRRSASILGLAGIAAVLPACSLMGLTDGLEPAACTGQPGFCDDLNDSHPTDDPCLRWRCDATSGLCAVLPTDMDGDGYVAAGCGVTGEQEDCDDEDGNRSPGAAEICDGLDNDCDGVVDEGAFGVERQLLGQIASSGGLHALAYAVSEAGHPYAAGLADDGSPALAVIPEALDRPAEVAPLAFTRDETSIALSAQAVAVAAMEDASVVAVATSDHGNGCLRIVLGLVNESDDTLTVAFDEPSDRDHFDEGLADDAGQRCSPGYQVATPAMAAAGDDILLAYVNAPPESRTFCRSGETDPPEPAPVLVSTARRRADGDLVRDEVASALSIGESTDNAAPAIMALDDRRWLVAFAAAGGEVVVTRVDVVVNPDTSRELRASEVLRLPGEPSEPRGEVALARGPATDETIALGLAYRQGCGGEASVELWLLEIDAASGDVSATGDPIAIAQSSRQDRRRPVMSWWGSAGEWLVVVQHGLTELVGLRLDASGAPIDEALMSLLEVPEATGAAFAERALAFPTSDHEGHGVVGYVPGDTSAGLWGVRVGCGGP